MPSPLEICPSELLEFGMLESFLAAPLFFLGSGGARSWSPSCYFQKLVFFWWEYKGTMAHGPISFFGSQGNLPRAPPCLFYMEGGKVVMTSALLLLWSV